MGVYAAAAATVLVAEWIWWPRSSVPADALISL